MGSTETPLNDRNPERAFNVTSTETPLNDGNPERASNVTRAMISSPRLRLAMFIFAIFFVGSSASDTILVYGAGTEAANGLYTKNGEISSSGKPKYESPNGYIIWYYTINGRCFWYLCTDYG